MGNYEKPYISDIIINNNRSFQLIETVYTFSYFYGQQQFTQVCFLSCALFILTSLVSPLLTSAYQWFYHNLSVTSLPSCFCTSLSPLLHIKLQNFGTGRDIKNHLVQYSLLIGKQTEDLNSFFKSTSYLARTIGLKPRFGALVQCFSI